MTILLATLHQLRYALTYAACLLAGYAAIVLHGPRLIIILSLGIACGLALKRENHTLELEHERADNLTPPTN